MIAGKLLVYKSKSSCSTVYKYMGGYQGRFILDLSRNYNVVFIQRFLLNIRLQRTTRNTQHIMKSLRPYSRAILLQGGLQFNASASFVAVAAVCISCLCPCPCPCPKGHCLAICSTPPHLQHLPSAILFACCSTVNQGRFAERSIGPSAIPLDVDAIAAEAIAPVHGVVFGCGVWDSLCRARWDMLRQLQRVMRSATVVGLVAAITRSFLSL